MANRFALLNKIGQEKINVQTKSSNILNMEKKVTNIYFKHFKDAIGRS